MQCDINYKSTKVNHVTFIPRAQTGSGAHPASYPMGTRGLSLGVKRPGRESDHSSPSSAEAKIAWSYTSTPQYAFSAQLRKHRDILSFYL